MDEVRGQAHVQSRWNTKRAARPAGRELPSVHIPHVVHLGRRPPLPHRTMFLMGLGPRCILWHHHMMPCIPRRPHSRHHGRLLRGGTRRGESGLGRAANEEHAEAAFTVNTASSHQSRPPTRCTRPQVAQLVALTAGNQLVIIQPPGAVQPLRLAAKATSDGSARTARERGGKVQGNLWNLWSGRPLPVVDAGAVDNRNSSLWQL